MEEIERLSSGKTMTVLIEFRIRFDGPVPGLSENRLSLAAFRTPLSKLLQALRQTADSVKQGKDRSRTGKFGKLFDLQLIQITDGCATPHFAFVAAKTDEVSEEKITQILTTTLVRFIDELKSEWRSSAPRESGISKYLQSLPKGLTTQEYEGIVDGKTVGKAILSTRIAAEPDKDDDFRRTAPRLRQVVCKVVAIRFASKDGRITLRTPTGETFVCHAATRLLDLATKEYKNPLVAQILVRHDMNRLISIRDEHGLFEQMPLEDRRQHLLSRWSETLKRLAE